MGDTTAPGGMVATTDNIAADKLAHANECKQGNRGETRMRMGAVMN